MRTRTQKEERRGGKRKGVKDLLLEYSGSNE